MTAEERVKLWKANGEYNKKVTCFAACLRINLTKDDIAAHEGLTVEELDEIIAYDSYIKRAFEKNIKVMKAHFVSEAYDRAFGCLREEHVSVRETIDSNGKASRVRSSKQRWHDGNGEAFFYWAKKFLGSEYDNDEENREFKRENKVKCVKPKKKK